MEQFIGLTLCGLWLSRRFNKENLATHTYRHGLESFSMSSHRCTFIRYLGMVMRMLGDLLVTSVNGERQGDQYQQVDCIWGWYVGTYVEIEAGGYG